MPHAGIYAVRAQLPDGQVDGVLHIGPRPTFPGLPPVFDFDGDLYGDRIRVYFVTRIRDVARFESTEALIAAMEQDCVAARAALR